MKNWTRRVDSPYTKPSGYSVIAKNGFNQSERTSSNNLSTLNKISSSDILVTDSHDYNTSTKNPSSGGDTKRVNLWLK